MKPGGEHFCTYPTLGNVVAGPAKGLDYGLSVEELGRRAGEFNPIDNLAPLAQANVKVLHLHGDRDILVPTGANSEELARRYREFGGQAEFVLLKGLGAERAIHAVMTGRNCTSRRPWCTSCWPIDPSSPWSASKCRGKMKERASHSRQTIASLALLLVVLLPNCARAQHAADTNAADFYVATNGRDDWSGRVAEPNADLTDGPFATLTRARNAVRALKKVSDKKNFVVRIRGGTYLFRETLVFSLEDSAPNGGTITYAAYPHEKPILSSGVPIRGWRRLRENPPGLPAAARGKVWVADLPPGFDRLLSFYDGEERLPRARTKGFTPPEFVKPNQPLDQFRFPAGSMKNWPDLKEAELLVIPSCDYEMNILPIACGG